MAQTFDLLIIGGGPAGLATAIELSRLGRSVLVVEKSNYDRPRPGETLPPEIKNLLQSLGAWDAFLKLPPIPFRGVVSAWGSHTPGERSSILHPLGEGWHVDRARFDQLLAQVASNCGAVLRSGTLIRSLEQTESGWRAMLGDGEEIQSRYLVDASGRGAPATIGQFPERHWMRIDRQVALLATMSRPAEPLEPILLLEAVPEGWWYSVPQPGGTILVALVTDADLLPPREDGVVGTYFHLRLSESEQTKGRCSGAVPAGAVWFSRSDSGLSSPRHGRGWCVVGDAAMACDPLAGDGVVRALRSARDAVSLINAGINGDIELAGAATDYRSEFLAYLEGRARYYQFERRWPNAPFWARRQPVDWKEAPIFLDPLAILRVSGIPLSREALAPVEALLPPRSITELKTLLVNPLPAHEIMNWLRTHSPVADRQLLVGLQFLVHLGVLESVGPQPQPSE